MAHPHNWERDKRSFANCLKEWAASRGSRQLAADDLRVPLTTLHGWCAGRACDREATVRRLMTLTDAVNI